MAVAYRYTLTAPCLLLPSCTLCLENNPRTSVTVHAVIRDVRQISIRTHSWISWRTRNGWRRGGLILRGEEKRKGKEEGWKNGKGEVRGGAKICILIIRHTPLLVTFLVSRARTTSAMQLDLESGTFCRRNSDSRICYTIMHSRFRQLLNTFLFGQWDQRAV